MKAFKPYGRDQDAKNPNYNPKIRRTVDPGVFDGDKVAFNKWVIKMADHFTADNETFKDERARMIVINAKTEGNANDLIEGRYRSEEIPFSSAAEMIATLAAVYHDANQGTKAREELRSLMFDITDKNADIHMFIGTVNSLADRANIARDDRKMTLYEHIPAWLDVRLLRDSKDPSISYEAFAESVADAALAQQRAFSQRREKYSKGKKHFSSDHKDKPQPVKKEEKFTPNNEDPKAAEKKLLKMQGKCFLCQETGHIARNCPQRKVIQAILQGWDEEEAEETQTFSSASSGSEN